MKRYFLFLFLIISSATFSQEEAWVYFNGKPNAQVYYDNPLLMLTQRALDRRSNQKIALDIKDIPVETTYINQVKASAGITVMAQSKWLNALHIRGTQANINSLKLLAFVSKVDFANNALNSTAKKITSDKVKITDKNLKTAVNYSYGTSANQIQMLNGQILHEQNYTGSGKIIAVLDAGFPGVNTASTFERLRVNNKILGGYNYVLRSPNFNTGDSHGTEVLSTMGGYKENALVGTAPDASYYLFITEDDASENPVEESLWVEAAEEADRLGADIITTSLGYFEYDNPNYSHVYSDMNGTTNFISRGAEIAFSKGMIVVASAGNEGDELEKHIGAPADAMSVITVGSVTASKMVSNFSSIGPSYDGRIKPDVMAQGSAAVVSDVSGNIVRINGTSFSCPIMAGTIACLWQAFPNKTNQEIRQLVLQSSDRYTSPNVQYGYGIPNFSLALNTGLDVESIEKTNFLVYPNPTKSSISFVLSKEVNVALVCVYSLLGQKVIEKEITNQSSLVSLQSLNSGIYFYTLEAGNFYKTGKIIKQ
ncbi:S8 family serine peptidase [Flavobacterium branchiarum]|uniref:S8 family serine peptidase n=1 Tax=Flavobacterium branchiarum TaxID=1114870 RepID=A0ABV5FHW4_9FLAO|nr:S8 family serine peptidase [Flavobacterium branchiarum]MDN3674021.1 S8 family serine peptidase [Flavobacterium branchiarum]